MMDVSGYPTPTIEDVEQARKVRLAEDKFCPMRAGTAQTICARQGCAWWYASEEQCVLMGLTDAIAWIAHLQKVR